MLKKMHYSNKHMFFIFVYSTVSSAIFVLSVTVDHMSSTMKIRFFRMKYPPTYFL